MQLMDFRMEIDQSNEDLEQISDEDDRCSSPKISGSTPGGNNNKKFLHAESEQWQNVTIFIIFQIKESANDYDYFNSNNK